MGRVCKTCKEEKELSEFSSKETRLLKSGFKTYLNSHCNTCHNIRNLHYKRKNPSTWIRSRYNVDTETASYWYEQSMTFCHICGKEWEEGQEKLCIDHNHNTQQIRGVLCKQCNYLLGHAYDNPDILESALVYLKKNGG